VCLLEAQLLTAGTRNCVFWGRRADFLYRDYRDGLVFFFLVFPDLHVSKPTPFEPGRKLADFFFISISFC
jgi:hypothetical protein